MPVFKFEGVFREEGYHHHVGTLVASCRRSAKERLIEDGYQEIWLRRLTGFKALMARLIGDYV